MHKIVHTAQRARNPAETGGLELRTRQAAGKRFSCVLFCLLAIGLAAVPVRGGTPSAQATDAHDWTRFDQLVLKSQKTMMADPRAALDTARAAAAIATYHRSSPRRAEAMATSLWLEAEALTRTNRIHDAGIVLAEATKLAASDGKITKLDGDLALSRARVADNNGDVATALKSYQQAHSIFVRLGNSRSQSIALQGLGSIYDKAHDFTREIGYYREAFQVYSGDPALDLSATNNIGFALQQTGHYDEAITHFRRALKIASSLDSPFLEARILTNLAVCYAKQHKLGNAERAADEALRLLGRRDENGWAPFVWGVKADIEYQRGAAAAALADLKRAFGGINLTTTIAPYRDIHEIAYKVYRWQGNLPLAMAHLEAFKRLDDEGRSLAASANLALMGAQFDFASQQLEIARLKAAQLRRDISLRESRAATQKVALAAAVIACLLLLAWIVWRHSILHRHRNAIAEKNVELTESLAQRDLEIARRVEVEAQLRLAVETAQQASRAKSHFLANMSHELRTPLNAVIGFAELIMQGELGQEKSRDYAGNIAEGGRNLLATLNDILDMARIEAGRVTLDENVVRLHDIVDHAISVLGCDPRASQKQVRFVGGNRDVTVRGDELRLRQVLINLVSNAVKFTSDNGAIEIAIERSPDGGVDLVVADNGFGIPADKISVILEPFGQAESSYARSHGGVGLGLPIVKSLVELHGGHFTIANGSHGGTITRVHLPADRVLILQRPASDRLPLSTTAAA
jgi:signal transduction histidine kinase